MRLFMNHIALGAGHAWLDVVSLIGICRVTILKMRWRWFASTTPISVMWKMLARFWLARTPSIAGSTRW